LKILVVCGAGRLFGKETVTLSLMEGLRNRGHEVRCIASTWKDGRFEKCLQDVSIPYDLLPLGFISKTFTWSVLRMTWAQAFRLPQLWVGYRKVVSSFQPDVVLHSTFHHVFLLWPLFGDKPNIFHVHESFAATPFYRRLFKVLSRRISLFVGVSKFVAETLINLGVPEPKVRYVLNGIAKDNSSSSGAGENGSKHKEHAPQRNGQIRIGIVGQIGEWKGHEDLIDALRILEENQEPFVCRIFGSGSPEFAATLKSRIEAYKLTNKVEWMGFVDDRKLIYDGMDVCVVPSRGSEPFGMVAAEALMYGIPVVASRTGGLPEVVLDEDCGYLVDTRSPEQIADRIRELSGFCANRSGIGRIANAQVLTVLSAKRMIDEMETLFESLITDKPTLTEETN
jgi:glycosyltransferase involved in cell wall biosynthesis